MITPAGQEPRGTFIVYHGNEESAEPNPPLADVFVRAGISCCHCRVPGSTAGDKGERTMKAAVAASREVFTAARRRNGANRSTWWESLGAAWLRKW